MEEPEVQFHVLELVFQYILEKEIRPGGDGVQPVNVNVHVHAQVHVAFYIQI